MVGERHAIRIPGTLLDELRDQDYANDARFDTNTNKRKRKTPVGRKEKRKQQRQEKRHKSKGNSEARSSENNEKIAAKKAPKVANNKPKKQDKRPQAVEDKMPFSSDDELSEGDFEEFGSEDLDQEEWQQLQELEQGDSDDQSMEHESEDGQSDHTADEDSDNDFAEMTVEETMEALRKAKEGKSNSNKQRAALATTAATKGDSSQEESDEDIGDDTDEELTDESDDEQEEMTVEETMAALKRVKENKAQSKKNSGLDRTSQNESELSEDQSDEEFADDMDEELTDESDDEQEEMTVEETMAALKRVKENKAQSKKNFGLDRTSQNESELSEDQSDEEFADDMDEELTDESDDEQEEMTVEETMAALKRVKENKAQSKKNSGLDRTSQNESELSEDQSDEEFADDMDEELTDESDDEQEEMTVEETMAALKRVKENKAQSKKNSGLDRTSQNESELSEDQSDEEFADDMDEELTDESDDEQEEMTVEETMAALKRAKQEKNKVANEKISETKAALKNANKKSKKTSGSEYDSETVAPPTLTPSELAQAQKDKWDYDYYAKKLGIKGKSKKLKASDEFDAIGGLLEGLDFFEKYGSEGSESETVEEDESYNDQNVDSESEEEISRSAKNEDKPFSSDDELSEGDFDEFDENDLNEEELEQLRELEDESSDAEKSTKRENPYVAPVASEPAAYVPPSLRKKNLEDNESESVMELRKKVKSSLNKLSESNITVIVSALGQIYDSYPRQHVNDALANQILEVVSHRDKLLDSFIINYAAVVFSLWKLRGAEVGASFIQRWVERLLHNFERDQKLFAETKEENGEDLPVVMSKECNNSVALLSYCYNFGLVSCRLIYDVIEMLIKTPNEFTTELLLRIISISGQLIRGDDPKALKEIISELLSNVRNVKQSPRMKFLLEVMTDLKNNRLKPSLLAASHASVKKSLSHFTSGASSTAIEPLQVTLDDIQNIETKGKWWLVGASWKGNMDSAFEDKKSLITNSKKGSANNIIVEDNILDDIPDWSEIARSQRMNTEVRRAIFVSVMSAQDFMDAFTNVEKLNLKNKQSLEIPRVLLHCLAMEGSSGAYNPFYALLAVKLSQQNHHVAKAFQFMFWDMIKKFENNDDSDDEDAPSDRDDDLNEDQKLKKVSCQGRFFGALLAEEVLKLEAFKHVPLMGGLNSDGSLFIEILVFQFLLSVAKKSEVRKKVQGKKALHYEGSIFERIVNHSLKFENSSTIFAAFNVFLNKKFKYQTFITEPEGTKGHEREVRRLSWALPYFTQLIKEGMRGESF